MERPEFDERFYLLTAGDRFAIEDYLSLPACDDAVGQLAPAKSIKEVLDRPRMVKNALAARRLALAKSLSDEGLEYLLSRLAKGHGIRNWKGVARLHFMEDAQPVYSIWEAKNSPLEAEQQGEDPQKLLADVRWTQSTGPRSEAGRHRSSRNADKGERRQTCRELARFLRSLRRTGASSTRTDTSEAVSEIRSRS